MSLAQYIALQDRQVAVSRLARDAAHHVNAELQSERMHIVGQGLEAGAVGCRGKSIGRRHETPPVIHAQLGIGSIFEP